VLFPEQQPSTFENIRRQFETLCARQVAPLFDGAMVDIKLTWLE
jgi:hypothetical protein